MKFKRKRKSDKAGSKEEGSEESSPSPVGDDDGDDIDFTKLDGYYLVFFPGGGTYNGENFDAPESPPKLSDEKTCVCTGEY